ncbi:MAG: PRC-barrel domain-containing protein [Clostridia bacterium]|nr:PRC-barrel domain-containing protein [Clostridia bacterium]
MQTISDRRMDEREMRLLRILGLPVILGQKRIGHVERVALDEQGKQVRGVVIRRGMGPRRWVGREGVQVLGDVSLVLQQTPGRLPPDVQDAPHRVTDESGLTLGRVTDAWLRADTLDVAALEVTLGPCEDLLRGRLRIHGWAIQPAPDGTLQVVISRREWEVLT